MQHENILTNYEIMISFHVYSLKTKISSWLGKVGTIYTHKPIK